MDINGLIRDLETKFTQIMNGIVISFEESNDLNHAELASKWEDSKNEVKVKMYAHIYETITELGVSLNSPKKSDGAIITPIAEIFPKKVEGIVDEYYYTKIKPIIFKALH